MTKHSHYEVEIDKLISRIPNHQTDIAGLQIIQGELDKLASEFQSDETLGPKRYKLYKAQSMINYYSGNIKGAEDFIIQSVKVKGSSYKFADELLQHLAASKPKKSVKTWVVLIAAPFAALFLVVLLQLTVNFVFSTTTDSYGTSYSSSPVVTVVNIFSFLIGFISVIGIMLMPLWIVMIIRALSFNSDGSLNKAVAIILAVVMGMLAWVYTYERDKTKFWVSIFLSIITFSIWSIVAWVWAIIDMASKPDEFYDNYFKELYQN